MSKIKRIFTNARVLILLVVLLFAVVAIHPSPWSEGVSIRNVLLNSSANLAGFENPKPGTQPMNQERIISINNEPIYSLDDYFDTKRIGSPLFQYEQLQCSIALASSMYNQLVLGY